MMSLWVMSCLGVRISRGVEEAKSKADARKSFTPLVVASSAVCGE